MLPERIEIALADYDRRRDRDVPPVFVGRDDELRFLRDTVEAAKSGARGVTAIVQGIPGAGKSALCAQVERELQASAADEAPVVVVSKECDFFNRSPVSMVKELAAEAPVRLDRLRRLPGFEKAEDHIGKALGVATALLKRGSSLDLAMQAMNLDESSSLGAALDAFAERMWPAGITLILAIDEAQGMEDTPQVRSNLRAIHGKRFATNIAILAFGLQDTAARLRELGLSRLASGQIRHLGQMISADSARLVDRTLDHLGLTAEDEAWCLHTKERGFSTHSWTAWRDAAKALILEESADFPHHLVNGIRGVCQVALAGGPRHLGERELDTLRQAYRRSKEEYHWARLEPFRGPHSGTGRSSLHRGRCRGGKPRCRATGLGDVRQQWPPGRRRRRARSSQGADRPRLAGATGHVPRGSGDSITDELPESRVRCRALRRHGGGPTPRRVLGHPHLFIKTAVSR